MCAGLCPTYWTTFGNAEENRNGSCPLHEWDHPPFFWVFNSPSTRPPGADGPQRGKGHVGRHCPYTYKIWCGSVHALLRYRSKTIKMQKFPIDSYSSKNFISTIFRPLGAANPKRGKTHLEPEYAHMQNLAWIGPRDCREIVDKKTKNKNKHTVKLIPRGWRVINI